MSKKNGPMTSMQPTSIITKTIPMIFGNYGAPRSSFLIDLELVVLDFQQTQFLWKTLMKALEHGMVAYFL